MSIVAIVRTSTDKQENGIEGQTQDVQRYAEEQDATVKAILTEDDTSGTLDPEKRPTLLSGINMLEKGDVLLFTSRDRIARDTDYVAYINYMVRKQGACIKTLRDIENLDVDTAALVSFMDDWKSQKEVNDLKRRINRAFKVKKDKGEKLGGLVPFGKTREYNADDKAVLVDNLQELSIIETMRSLKVERRYSLRQISAYLGKQGVVNRKGKVFSASSVKNILGDQS